MRGMTAELRDLPESSIQSLDKRDTSLKSVQSKNVLALVSPVLLVKQGGGT